MIPTHYGTRETVTSDTTLAGEWVFDPNDWQLKYMSSATGVQAGGVLLGALWRDTINHWAQTEAWVFPMDDDQPGAMLTVSQTVGEAQRKVEDWWEKRLKNDINV